MALGDAVIALTAKQAIKNSRDPSIGHGHIKFQPEWFEVDDPAVPEARNIAEANQILEREKRNLGMS